VIERPTRPLRPTRSNPPNHMYHISTRTRTSSTISPSSRAKLRGGGRKRGSEGRWGKLSRDLNRSAKGAGRKGAGHVAQGAGQHGGAVLCPPFVLAHGVRQRGARTHALFPRAHSSATVTDTPPPPRRAARCVRVVGRLPEMATPSRVRLGWCQRRRRAAPAAAARAGGRRVRWLGGLAAVEGESTGHKPRYPSLLGPASWPHPGGHNAGRPVEASASSCR